MLIKKKKPWEMPEREATPESVYMGRRKFIRSAGLYGLGMGLFLNGLGPGLLDLFGGGGNDDKKDIIKIPSTPTSGLYPAKRNERFALGRPLTDELVAARYNNFYEFSPLKSVWRHSDKLEPRPWTIEVGGLVEKPFTIDIDTLVRRMPLEERLYRLRCVEAWAMAVPWTGFPVREFIKLARPLSSARYVRMRTFHNKKWAIQQRLRFWLPWPYQEGLTMKEASNELAMLVTGIYGHELPNQHGAPVRLIVPWKYGFKNIKSIVRIDFVEKEPETFWNTLAPDEYKFESNVDPEVPHPRWSQATERIIWTDEVMPTIKYNGYGEYVRGLYGG